MYIREPNGTHEMNIYVVQIYVQYPWLHIDSAEKLFFSNKNATS